MAESKISVQEALNNIVIVVSNSKMTAKEHDVLRESISMVVIECNRALELQKKVEDLEKLIKHEKED